MELCRQEYWSGLPFSPSGYLPNPGMEPPTSGTRVCCLPGGFFTIESRRKLPFRDTIYVNVWYVKCAGFSFLILLDITRSSSKKGSSNWHFHQQMYEWLSYPHPYQDWTLSFAGGVVFLFVLPIWWYLSLLFSCPFPWLLESMNIILKNIFIRHLSFSSRNFLITFTYFYQNIFLNQFLEHLKCFGFDPLSAICIAKIVSPHCHWLCLWFFNMCKI